MIITFISFTQLHYDSVILLIRNPFHAIVSEKNRLLTVNSNMNVAGNMHTGTFNETFFMNNLKWKKFVNDNINRWRGYFNWMINIPKGHTILVIRYEDLKDNVITEMRKILDFLHYKTIGIYMMTYACTFNMP